MTYDPKRQYRCTIIRGKARSHIDDLLPAYANIINEICPSNKEPFAEMFDKKLAPFLPSPTKKTLNNHRTEIAGKLFGMWKGEDGLIVPTERTMRLLKDRDQPEFFKEIISKLQFPNGMDKIQTIMERIKMKINFRPGSFVLMMLLVAEKREMTLTVNEIAYYALNSLDVLQGKVAPDEVVETVVRGRASEEFARVEVEGKASSYTMQHIRELLDLMELANLIRIKRDGNLAYVSLNHREMEAIEYIAGKWNEKLEFDVYRFNLADRDEIKRMDYEWSQYYSRTETVEGFFSTAAGSLTQEEIPGPVGADVREIGEEGEIIVFESEKRRVGRFNVRLTNKVIYVGKQRGLGYDIVSIRAERPNPEHHIYIEVKTTKRVTSPRSAFRDQFVLTRNEWVAAEQHRDNYFIFRVYITNEGVKVFKMSDPVKMSKEEKIYAAPLNYGIEFECCGDRLGDIDA